MKRLLICLLSLLPLLLLPLDSSADKDKGPSDRAYERANENASFKRDDDDDDGDNKEKKRASTTMMTMTIIARTIKRIKTKTRKKTALTRATHINTCNHKKPGTARLFVVAD